MQTKVETAIRRQQRAMFIATLGAAHCMTDEWHGMDMAALRAREREVIAQLGFKGSDEEEATATHGGGGGGHEVGP